MSNLIRQLSVYSVFVQHVPFYGIYILTLTALGTGCRSSLRHCSTSQKVAGSIPDGVIGNFQ